MQDAAQLFGAAPNAALYAAIAELSQIIALLDEWRSAVLDAGPDASRFVAAATARAGIWLDKNRSNEALSIFRELASSLTQVSGLAEVATVAAQLAAIALPVGIYNAPQEKDNIPNRPKQGENSDDRLTVAFLKFTVDGVPLNEVHFVTPGDLHDLDIEVRVSRWPPGATGLIVEPVTIEQASTYQMPVFSFPAQQGTGPFLLHEKGRARLAVPHHINARPFEFKYVAKFVPRSSEQPVGIVGQRTLLLEGLDLVRNPITGYAHIDAKLIEMRDRLRQAPGVLQQELLDALTLVAAIANYAGQVAQDNIYKEAISESDFQERMRIFLRSQPMIGCALEEHPHAAGGITDLSFKGIRLELKSEPDTQMRLEDCRQFVAQAASYAVASGKRIAVLCVLDCSKKTKPPFPVEDGIGVLVHQSESSATFVVTVLLQGNLARPSSHSR
jgi:hypothetical protein